MPVEIQITEPFQPQIDSALVQIAAQAALHHQGAAENAVLSIVITGNEQLQQLNKQFRDLDAPTDVLSFPADYVDPENQAPYLGDLLISCPQAESQALAAGHDLMAEIQLLVVHGILHLLGHDHAGADQKARMWTAQAEILGVLGLGDISVPS
ncbi:MAG: rRNA maturation RNase YbeY [Chloroflexota bacterium]